MSWQDRVRDHIKLTSPSGLEFTPGWKGDDQTIQKRVGRHAYPSVDKEVAQDMGLGSLDIPLTLYFEGADNDTQSRAFLRAWSERGVWTVVHPVDGTLFLQPLTATRPTQPVTSGNLTVVATTWMEPLQDAGPASTSSLPGAVSDAATAVIAEAADSLAAEAVQDVVSETAALESSAESALSKIKKLIATGSARINAIQAQIQETIASVPADMLSFAGEITQLLQSPGLMAGSARSQVQALASTGRSILSDLPAALGSGNQDRNYALVVVYLADAITAAMAETIISELPETRPQALTMLDTFLAYEYDVEASLDALATASSTLSIDHQFYGHSAAANSALAKLRASVSAYLLGIMGDLKTERRFTIDRPRTPLEIAITECEATADTADYFYDCVCRWNNLRGRDVLLLPTGREVVLYA